MVMLPYRWDYMDGVGCAQKDIQKKYCGGGLRGCARCKSWQGTLLCHHQDGLGHDDLASDFRLMNAYDPVRVVRKALGSVSTSVSEVC